MDNHSKTALIVEDDYSIYHVLDLMLQFKNIVSYHADSLSATNSLINDISPDLIFLDHCLPDGFGIEMVPELRKAFSGSRIIIMTAQNTPANKSQALANGSDYFLEKPFTLNDVYESISTQSEKSLSDIS
ncbi:MAG TPA: response regulator [Bacteroidales bacterium]|nr:response regulator [Bacteroidales bacterium]